MTDKRAWVENVAKNHRISPVCLYRPNVIIRDGEQVAQLPQIARDADVAAHSLSL